MKPVGSSFRITLLIYRSIVPPVTQFVPKLITPAETALLNMGFLFLTGSFQLMIYSIVWNYICISLSPIHFLISSSDLQFGEPLQFTISISMFAKSL